MDGASDDDIIRERAFRISDKLDLGDLVDDSQFVKEEVSEAVSYTHLRSPRD